MLDLILTAIYARTSLADSKAAALEQLAAGKPQVFTGREPGESQKAPAQVGPGSTPGTVTSVTTTPPATRPQGKNSGLTKRTDLPAAREMAPLVAQELSAKGKSYARPLLEQFQWYTGLKDKDGLYGPQSAGALAWALNQEPGKVPASMFPIGAAPVAYTPPAV